MSCRIEVAKIINNSIIRVLPYKEAEMSRDGAKAIADELNALWGPIAKPLRITSETFQVSVFGLKEAIDREYEKQVKAEQSFKRDLDFFMDDVAIQDSAKQTITEVRESDVEAKVRELEEEGLLEIDCKGKLKAEKGLVTSFTKGGKWKVIKDLKDYPIHKEGGIDLTIGKDGVSIKNGNTQFTAKHGLVIPKN